MLALMDAGVPVKGMVAGISIGLVSEAGDDGQLKRYELLPTSLDPKIIMAIWISSFAEQTQA
jgi:Polyribonucleotide nucleotidyltransferase (polynucleotide phosphorylase)